jgi:hypothetical protein
MSEIKKAETEKKSDPLSSFMKQQMAQKAQHTMPSKDPFAASRGNNKGKQAIAKKEADKKDKKDGKDEEMSEEEKELEEAKKASRSKAAERDQTDMYKKMIKEAIVKYVILFSALGILAIAVIKVGPAMVAFFNGGISRALMGAIGQ